MNRKDAEARRKKKVNRKGAEAQREKNFDATLTVASHADKSYRFVFT